MKSTPRPWIWLYYNHGGKPGEPGEPFGLMTADEKKDVLLATDSADGRVIIEISEADAEFVLRAVNEIDELRRWQSNLYQDACEGALVEVSLLDEARRIIAELQPDHPFLSKPMASFGVWESQRKEIERLRAELATAQAWK